VTLREEMELLRRFLAIEKVRFGSRLEVDAQVDAQCEDCMVPPLILQPLVENAIVHGIANLPQGGTVKLRAQCGTGQLQISIENSFDPEATPSRKGGMGLKNVRQRVQARYPNDGSVRATAHEDSFRVDLSIPVELPAPAATETIAEVKPAPGALKEIRS
jgi:two-component system, LytTR family, sensor histidine kinase AlgZ